jgi:hypothetical protein
VAESVKRRVAAARLAVAFVAAGTIAGATAWAQAEPPPAASGDAELLAKGEHIKKAVLTVRSSANVADGSLLFQDFKKGQVPSLGEFKRFEKVIFHRYYPKVQIDKTFIKGESSDYVKHSDLAPYIKGESTDFIKSSEDVVRGKGSVLSATAVVPDGQKRDILDAPGMFTVDATGPTLRITNTSGSPLSHTGCGGVIPPGTLAPGENFTCDSNGMTQTVQLLGTDAGGGPQVSTVSFSGFSGQGVTQQVVQILIGL